jgi:APA family basic amino acid/polyamine antiporter
VSFAADLLARKPLSALIEESRETGTHSLKRSLGIVQLTALGVGAVLGAGIFVVAGMGAHYAGPAVILSFVLSGLGCALAGLCYAEFAATIPLAGSAYTYAYASLGEIFAWIVGWDLTLEYAMAASAVSSGWSNYFVEFIGIFHLKMPLWLAYDHATAVRAAEAVVARRMAQSSDGLPVAGSVAFSEKALAIANAHSPELIRRAHALLDAPRIFGVEIGFNLPALAIALAVTAILVTGIRKSAQFNVVFAAVKVAVILFVVGFGIAYIDSANWGSDWSTFAPFGFAGIGAGAAYVFFAYIGFDAVCTTAQEAIHPQRDLPIAIVASLLICTVFYIAVAAVLTGMTPWREINIEAPIARAFLDRGLIVPSQVITAGALAGLTSVMLVTILGQTRILYSMANDGLLPKRFFAEIHPRFRTPWKNTILVGMVAAVVGSTTPIYEIGRMVNIGTLLAFVTVCIALPVLRRTEPALPRPFRTPWVPLIPILGVVSNGYLMCRLGWLNWARLIVWLAIGLAVYFMYGRKHSRIRIQPSGAIPAAGVTTT